MQELRTRADAEEALAGTGVLFKHSTRCPVSYDAYDQVQRFALAHPDVTVWMVDVVAGRAVSRFIAGATGITHQSPQIIVLAGGEVRWHASHYGISSAAIVRHLDIE